jgi:hypothetical protein
MQERENCRVCQYSTWTTEKIEQRSQAIYVNEYSQLRISSQSGCTGCRVLDEAWMFTTPDLETRNKEALTFNKHGGHLYVHLFHDKFVSDLDVFTLPSM